MEIALYFANLGRLLDIEEAIRFVKYSDIPPFLSSLFFAEDTVSGEYFGNLVAVERLERAYASGAQPSRLYFGQEFCEHLIPSQDDVQKAFFFARQLGWDFTYVTGPVTDAGLDRVKANLEFLVAQDANCEVVANDWGVLSIVSRDYEGLEPVLGRLLIKQFRLARFTAPTKPPPVNMAGITAPLDEIRRNQVLAYCGLSLSNAAYRRRLADLGISRVDIDIVPQGVDLPEGAWGLDFSCYFPWGYVAGGRNCLTAATAQPGRGAVVVDGPCPRPCRRLNRAAVTSHGSDSIVQRGNTVFVLHAEYAYPYLDGTVPVNRIIFEPYIPI